MNTKPPQCDEARKGRATSPTRFEAIRCENHASLRILFGHDSVVEVAKGSPAGSHRLTQR